MATSWAQETDEHVNYTRLCRLLYDGGILALRTVFDKRCPPATLATTLATNQAKLLKLKKPKGRVLSQDQWDLLYPPSGVSPKSTDFDITLLFVLLRNICGLTSPATGWDALPAPTDKSLEANLARIKYYRNTVAAHCSLAAVDNTQFQAQWKEISSALVALGLKKEDIDKLESSPLGEKEYNQLVEYWDLCDKEIKQQLEAIKATQSKTKLDIIEIKSKQSTHQVEIANLAYIDYSSLIKNNCGKYHPSTRQWIFDMIKKSVKKKKKAEATVVLIRAGPGMGKSCLAAKICQSYDKPPYKYFFFKSDRILGGCHFFQHSDSLRNNPRTMLQSIARQLCRSVPGYQAALKTKLKTLQGRNISDLNCEELFGVLFEEPLSQIHTDRNVVIVIDALDECASQFKNELEDAFNKKISLLPPWIRFVITMRPLPSFRSLLSGDLIEMDPSDPRNIQDIKTFLNFELAKRSANQSFIDKAMYISENLFLVAFFVIEMLDQFKDQPLQNALQRISHGVSSVYEYYFTRIKDLITPYLDTSQSHDSFYKILEAVVASVRPIPKQMFYDILGLKSSVEVPQEKRKERNNALHLLHTIFPVENDHVTAFHKTVIDWLKGDANDNPEFSVSTTSGVKVLAEKSLEVLRAFKNEGQRALDQPLVLSDCETFAVRFGISYIIDSSKQLNEHDRVEILKDVNVIAAICFLGSFICGENLSERRDFGDKFVKFSFINQLVSRSVYLNETSSYERVLSVAGDSLLNLESSPLSPQEKDELRHWLIENNLPHYSCHSVFKFGGYISFNDKLFYDNGLIAVFIDKKVNLTVLNIEDGCRNTKQRSFDRSHEVQGFSPDKKHLIITKPYSKKLELYDVVTLKKVQEYHCPIHYKNLFHMFGDAEQWYVVIQAFDSKIYILDGFSGQFYSKINVSVGHYLVGVSKRGHVLIGRQVKVASQWHYDIHTIHFKKPDDKIRYKCIIDKVDVYFSVGSKFSEDGTYLAVYDNDKEQVFVFHTSDGTVYSVIDLELVLPNGAIGFISSSCLILIDKASRGSIVRCYDLLSNKLIYLALTPFDFLCNVLVVPPQDTDKFVPSLFGLTKRGELLKLEFHCLEQNVLDST